MEKSSTEKIFLLPVVISLLLLAGHFLRAGWIPLAILCLLLVPVVLISRDQLIVIIMRILLALGGIEWIRTAINLMSERAESGQPWLRSVIILGAVTCFTVASIFVFNTEALKERYKPANAKKT